MMKYLGAFLLICGLVVMCASMPAPAADDGDPPANPEEKKEEAEAMAEIAAASRRKRETPDGEAPVSADDKKQEEEAMAQLEAATRTKRATGPGLDDDNQEPTAAAGDEEEVKPGVGIDENQVGGEDENRVEGDGEGDDFGAGAASVADPSAMSDGDEPFSDHEESDDEAEASETEIDNNEEEDLFAKGLPDDAQPEHQEALREHMIDQLAATGKHHPEDMKKKDLKVLAKDHEKMNEKLLKDAGKYGAAKDKSPKGLRGEALKHKAAVLKDKGIKHGGTAKSVHTTHDVLKMAKAVHGQKGVVDPKNKDAVKKLKADFHEHTQKAKSKALVGTTNHADPKGGKHTKESLKALKKDPAALKKANADHSKDKKAAAAAAKKAATAAAKAGKGGNGGKGGKGGEKKPKGGATSPKGGHKPKGGSKPKKR